MHRFDGGPVGLDNIAASIGEERDTIEDVIEPYLIQQGYLQRTPRGRVATVTAYRVVVATGRPTELFRPLARHVKVAQTYFALTAPVPARIRRSLAASTALPLSAGAQPATPAVVTRDLAEPPHVVRWVDGDRVLVSGADGPLVPERSREKVIVQRTGQLMYELSTLYPEISGLAPANGWHAVYGATADGLPFIGPHRNFPRHLFAFGGGAHSSTDRKSVV